MEASKALGLAGFIIVGAIGLLAYLCYDANLFTVKDFFNSSSIEEDMKWVAGIGAAVVLLLLSVPGLILLWMSEVGHEIERISNATYKTNKSTEALQNEIQRLRNTLESNNLKE